MAVFQHKDGRWFIHGRPGHLPDEPKRTRQYFGRGASGESQARAKDSTLISRRPSAKGSDGPRFAELAAAYLVAKNFCDKSHRELMIRLEAIIGPAVGNLIALRITEGDLDRFVAWRRAHKTRKGSKVKDSTIRREITDIKAILNWAVRCRPPMIAYNPIAGYRSPDSDDEAIIPPSPEEAEAIYQAAAPHLRRAIVLAWYLGLRPGSVELLSITWAAVSEHSSTIRVQSAHKGGPRFRDVPIHRKLAEALEVWRKEDGGKGPLIHYHGCGINKIQKSWAGALAKAGITRRIRPYDIRHAFATRALEAGADIGAVGQIMGSNPETIRRHYQHVSRAMTRATVDLIPPLDNTTGQCVTKK